jgi:hypothetical protein
VSFVLIESVVWLLTLWMGAHAYSRGFRRLWTFLWSILFGLAVELAFVITNDHYEYGEFLVMVRLFGGSVPLWVATGWGVIVYASTLAAERWTRAWWAAAPGAGLLAVSVDLALDPVAHHLGFWTWHSLPAVKYYGVPYDNFVGWLIIVSSFVLCSAAGFRWVGETVKGRDLWLPPVTAVIATALVLLLDTCAATSYTLFGQPLVFGVTFAVVTLGLAPGFLTARRDHPLDTAVVAVPVVMHGVSIALAVSTGIHQAAPGVLVTLPLAALVSFLGFIWPSLDRRFPQRRPGAGG